MGFISAFFNVMRPNRSDDFTGDTMIDIYSLAPGEKASDYAAFVTKPASTEETGDATKQGSASQMSGYSYDPIAAYPTYPIGFGDGVTGGGCDGGPACAPEFR